LRINNLNVVATQIYYESDSTAEWIDLNAETVLVAQDILFVKHGASLYPCLTYWASNKGREELKKLRGYKKGGDFIEYFNETGFGEYSFANVKGLLPLQELPKGKNNKKFELFMASAQAEQSVVDSVVEVSHHSSCYHGTGHPNNVYLTINRMLASV